MQKDKRVQPPEGTIRKFNKHFLKWVSSRLKPGISRLPTTPPRDSLSTASSATLSTRDAGDGIGLEDEVSELISRKLINQPKPEPPLPPRKPVNASNPKAEASVDAMSERDLWSDIGSLSSRGKVDVREPIDYPSGSPREAEGPPRVSKLRAMAKVAGRWGTPKAKVKPPSVTDLNSIFTPSEDSFEVSSPSLASPAGPTRGENPSRKVTAGLIGRPASYESLYTRPINPTISLLPNTVLMRDSRRVIAEPGLWVRQSRESWAVFGEIEPIRLDFFDPYLDLFQESEVVIRGKAIAEASGWSRVNLDEELSFLCRRGEVSLHIKGSSVSIPTRYLGHMLLCLRRGSPEYSYCAVVSR